MRRPRFSIASLLGVVAFVALAIASLRASDDAWDSSLFGLTLLILLTAVLLALHGTHRKRAFWLGFALFGGAYLGAGLIPPIESRMPTRWGLASLDSLIRPRPGANTIAFSPDGRLPPLAGGGTIRLWDATTGKPLGWPGGTTENFVRIGHSLLALLMALLGGLLSRHLYLAGRVARDGEPVAGS